MECVSLLITLRDNFIVISGCNTGAWPDRRADFIPLSFCGTPTGVESTLILVAIRAIPVGVGGTDWSTNSKKLDFHRASRLLGICK